MAVWATAFFCMALWLTIEQALADYASLIYRYWYVDD